MPKEVKSKEEFLKIVERAEECRVKLSRTGGKNSDRKVLKVKARTKRYLYTIVFENVDEGIEFAKSLKDKCPVINVLDEEIQI